MRECSILVVEDDDSVRKSLGIVLAATGYRVRMAEDGFSALREMRIALPDILLSDLNMPGMSGFELLSVVRRRFPRMLVLAMSGTIADAFSGIAADAFHQKGGNLASLLTKLEALAGSRETIREREEMSTPVWIPTVTRDVSGRAIVTLSCPECLRTFSLIFKEVGQLIQDAICAHCGSAVMYAIVEGHFPEALPYRPMALVESAYASDLGLS